MPSNRLDQDESCGRTPNELARVLRVSPDRVRRWIMNGELGAINTASSRSGKPRYVILPHHLSAFERIRAAATAPKSARRRRRPVEVDYFPHLPG